MGNNFFTVIIATVIGGIILLALEYGFFNKNGEDPLKPPYHPPVKHTNLVNIPVDELPVQQVVIAVVRGYYEDLDQGYVDSAMNKLALNLQTDRERTANEGVAWFRINAIDFVKFYSHQYPRKALVSANVTGKQKRKSTSENWQGTIELQEINGDWKITRMNLRKHEVAPRQSKQRNFVLHIDRTNKFNGIGYKNVNVPRTINEIIITDTQESNIGQEIQDLKRYRVAYHYLIGYSGEVKLLVEESNVAIHTRGRNDHSIGIGLIHVSGETYPKRQMRSLVSLLADIVNRHNIQQYMIRASSQIDSKKKSDLPIYNIREKVKNLIEGR